MEHADLLTLRETYNRERILLCFNGPFTQGLIEEIGDALKRYMQSAASSADAIDVFAVYIEIAQNIQNYAASHGYEEVNASATVVIGHDEAGRYVISAGNVVEQDDAEPLESRINELAVMDRSQLRAAYKEQLRRPREETASGAGLGLIDMARKASEPCTCSVRPLEEGRAFFSLRVVI